MIYLLDTNVISDFLGQQPQVMRHVRAQLAQRNTLAICRPVYYEVLRGLLWRNATGKLRNFNKFALPLLTWVELMDSDWELAARFWADARRKGIQIGDPDLFLAALTYRLNATLISSDTDFDALPVVREDWRRP